MEQDSLACSTKAKLQKTEELMKKLQWAKKLL